MRQRDKSRRMTRRQFEGAFPQPFESKLGDRYRTNGIFETFVTPGKKHIKVVKVGLLVVKVGKKLAGRLQKSEEVFFNDRFY